ncbi:non-ribosomal peptide synthase (plasmid) [Vibrio anguillarum]|uniref:Anguibactin system regulator n=20 Tax=Vibrio anguillarum TaxID=55601 RepID=ANGR_VIBA7|nr:amino acid adenylation domain-containing protein [Vibrio anguillarum]Q6W4T3.1 RecName: Full=Anguibactin system regulator [Vibrio anguillarum 775]AAA79860.1 trans-acting transcriptional activator (angR) [Vibrio anguillarum]AAR12528.1 non-ribosomal peptide synthetase [Vibrio anguillarum 775]ATA51768.1 non-ribosomal peptide synthase [Vibrio anguillarum]AXN09304.1 non-ribosomal peptide synthase [Vibrio anguillarum]AXN12705.1 non-ribosomal peptide synthase [Vibrio anguillarum]
MNQNEHPFAFPETKLPLTSNQNWQLSTQRQRTEKKSITNFTYQEFDYENISRDTLERCLTTIIKHHPIFGAKLSDDFYLHFPSKTHIETFAVNDLSNALKQDIDKQLADTRSAVTKSRSQAIISIMFSILPKNIIRLHVRFNSVVVDNPSVTLFFEQLTQLLSGSPLSFLNQEQTISAYNHKVNNELLSVDLESARWNEYILTLPSSANLPTICEPEKLDETDITRRCITLSQRKWQQLVTVSKKHNVTPEITLASIFSTVLSLWGHQKYLMMRFDITKINDYTGIIGQFTEPLLVGMSGFEQSFLSLVKNNQKKFEEAYHYDVKVPVFQCVNKLSNISDSHRYPANITFSSELLNTNHSKKAVWGCRQSANTWLSLHAVIEQEQLVLQWDSQDAIFPKDMIKDMLHSYTDLLDLLSQKDVNWAQPLPTLLPKHQESIRNKINQQGDLELTKELLHQRFFKNVESTPNALAIIHGQESLDYITLASYAKSCAGALTEAGVKSGDRVAVTMNKGIGQIVAVLGILYAGAIYVPVSLDQPQERRESIYQGAGINVILINESDSKNSPSNDLFFFLDWQTAIKSEPMRSPQDVAPSQPAYIIYTSGSTGTPKGVVISHQGALNTCIAINRRYQIGKNDRVLALSALHFDLSVYDIFGLLSAGGTIVLVSELERRDPIAWCQAIEEHNVTMWNSVPALFDMLLTYATCFNSIAPSKLRLTMLSGDWIGLDLPQRYRNYRVDGQFIAMGGATEASIWSNVFDVEKVPMEWRSIPYGYPLPRQQYRVVDDLGRDCPDWVAGELWIGGDGIALGYFDDELKTQAQFLHIDGHAWYRTGDMGCYWPDGTLEFLGRRDKQVKVGGYRIELGEIEVALNNIPGVQRAVAIAVGNKDKTLAAFIVMDSEQAPIVTAPLDAEEVQLLLNKQLPNYMVPKRIIFLETFPLTANGKVDHKALTRMTNREKKTSQSINKPIITASEDRVAKIWNDVLGPTELYKSSDFFLSGGDAYNAIEVVKRCHKAGYLIKLSMLYRYSTIEAFAIIMDRCRLAPQEEAEL